MEQISKISRQNKSHIFIRKLGLEGTFTVRVCRGRPLNFFWLLDELHKLVSQHRPKVLD